MLPTSTNPSHATPWARRSCLLVTYFALACAFTACASSAAPAPAVPLVAVPVAPPGCGAIDVDDRSVPPNAAHIRVVRDALRQQLAALGSCAPRYRGHVDLKIDPVGASRVRVGLVLVVYAKDGALAAEIPTTVSGDRLSPEGTDGIDELLRVAAGQSAQSFSQHFH